MVCRETNQDPVSTSFNHPSIKINSNIRFNLDNQLVGSKNLSHIHPCIILPIFCLSTNKEGDEHLNEGRHKSSPVRHGASFLPDVVVVVQLKHCTIAHCTALGNNLQKNINHFQLQWPFGFKFSRSCLKKWEGSS